MGDGDFLGLAEGHDGQVLEHSCVATVHLHRDRADDASLHLEWSADSIQLLLANRALCATHASNAPFHCVLLLGWIGCGGRTGGRTGREGAELFGLSEHGSCKAAARYVGVDLRVPRVDRDVHVLINRRRHLELVAYPISTSTSLAIIAGDSRTRGLCSLRVVNNQVIAAEPVAKVGSSGELSPVCGNCRKVHRNLFRLCITGPAAPRVVHYHRVSCRVEALDSVDVTGDEVRGRWRRLRLDRNHVLSNEAAVAPDYSFKVVDGLS